MALTPGSEAPDFTLKDQNMQPVTLNSFRGQKNVMLVFYPFTFTACVPRRALRVARRLEPLRVIGRPGARV